MIVYLLKSMLCLLALLLIHRVLLQREVLHRFNRFFLLAAVLGSFLIPLYTIEVPAEEAPPMPTTDQVDLQANVDDYQDFVPEEEFHAVESSAPEVVSFKAILDKHFPWERVLLGVYLTISAIFLFRFLKNLRRLNLKIRKNPHVWYRDETLVLLPEVTTPFSFLKYIFVSRPSFEKEGISDAVFVHEQCHVREKHSWDVLLIEALMIPFWFHPGLYLARQAIRLNHEFIADQVALKSTQLQDYQQQLLRYINAMPTQAMASSLNFSLTKKRLAMMKKDSKNPFRWMKILVLVPLIAGIVYLFSDKVAVQPEEELGAEITAQVIESPVENIDINIRLLTEMEVEVDGKVIYLEQLTESLEKLKGEDMQVRLAVNPRLKMAAAADLQEILVENELRKVVYDEWPTYVRGPNWEEERASYFEKVHIIVEDKDMDYTHKTYDQLSEKEKTLLIGPMSVPSKKAPHPLTFEAWKSKDKYALWLDEKMIPNEELSRLQASDIVMFWTSRVMDNARSARFTQPFQVHLYTQEYYDKELGPNSDLQDPLTSGDTITLTSRRVTWHKDIQKYPDPNTAYLQKNARYEKLRTSGTIYPQKSNEEKALLDSLYRDLSVEYSKSSDKRKKSLKEPISPDSDIPRNGNPAPSSSETIGARTVGNGGDNDAVYTLALSSELQSKNLKEYLTLYGIYQTKAYENHRFSQKSPWQIEALRTEFSRLHSSYQRLSPEERQRVQRANFPYAKIEKDGKVVYRKFEELSPKEQEELMC